MKIAILANHGGSGGYIAYLKGLLSEKTSHDVMLFCTEQLLNTIGPCAENIKVHTGEYSAERGIDVFLDRALPAELINEVDTFCPDVVLFTPGWIRKGLEKYPCIMILHNQLYVDDKTFWKNISRKTLLSMLGFRYSVRRSMKRADGVIFLSEQSKYQADIKRIPYRKGTVIHFGMPEENISFSNRRESLVGVIHLLYVSAFFEYKNHDNLLCAVQLLKNKGYSVRLTLIGAVPEYRESYLKNYAIQLGIEEDVVFEGWKSHDDVISALDETDIYVYPSAVESTGLGVMEAMARGACIACSDMSCMPEVLKDAGLYFNPDDFNDIAGAIERLICDDSLRALLSSKAYRYAKDYSWCRATEKHYRFFENYCKD